MTAFLSEVDALSDPQARVVLLGASNLARGLPRILTTARQVLGGRRLDVAAALGHGRSYGMRSRVLVRSLPGIVECGLWRELASRPPRPTYALLTDVGNDVAYGADAPDIAVWVETCVRRLAEHGARTVLTALPRASLERLRPWQILLLRRLMFPSSRVTPGQVYDRVARLDDALRGVTRRHGAILVEQDLSWYGFDPIHIRWRQLPRAWPHILGSWRNDGATTAPPDLSLSFRDRLRLRLLVPDQRWLCGIEQRGPQPAFTRAGLTLSLY